ncbi:hypothetical protein GGR53DRAFT_49260 [Hypoxylon sp. FL1150]|nr:hypothetical protein GGR53DRAFT_49260 [Hypoxylon sp. FL1150]
MRLSHHRLRSAALLVAPFAQFVVLGQPTRTTTSPSPTITGDPFRGFAIAETKSKSPLEYGRISSHDSRITSATPIYCPSGELFTTSAGFAACRASTTTQFAFATACKDNAIAFEDGATSNCGPLKCQSRRIFPTFPANGSALVEPVCAGVGEVETLFRAVANDFATGLTPYHRRQRGSNRGSSSHSHRLRYYPGGHGTSDICQG